MDFNFEITGKMKIEKIEDGKHSGFVDPEAEQPFWKKYKFEIIWWAIFALLIILGMILPEGKFLELLYLFHKQLTYIVVFFFIIWEAYHTITDFIKRKPHKEIIKHLLLGLLIFIIIFKFNLLIYEKYVGPELTTIEISELKSKSEGLIFITEVNVFVRNVKVPIYLIVETPQGTKWIQSKRFVPNKQFKANLIEEVHLGGGYIGLGETFKIFTIGTEEDLKIGTITSIPSDSIKSNVMPVKRIE